MRALILNDLQFIDTITTLAAEQLISNLLLLINYEVPFS